MDIIYCAYDTDVLIHAGLFDNKYQKVTKYKMISKKIIVNHLMDLYNNYYITGNRFDLDRVLHNPYLSGPINKFRFYNNDTHLYKIPPQFAREIYDKFMATHPIDPFINQYH
jgi:hypothetical protein